MSSPLAIASVTATLRNLLVRGFAKDQAVADTTFTTLPLDKARTGTTNQVNVFLYEIATNAAWRNQDMPSVKPGETGRPPLALDLHYLVTTFGRDNDEVRAHHLLGRSMSILHDHPLLGATEIRAALPDSGLDTQPERIRITPLSISLDEQSKLWTAFQSQFRMSAAYRASVVLIESALPTKTPLPVLTREPRATGDLIPPFPALTGVDPPPGQAAARLGDVLGLRGFHLDGDAVTVRLTSPLWADPVDLAPQAGATATHVAVKLPNDAGAQLAWPAGVYAVSVVVTKGGQQRVTNALPVPLAERIANVAPNPAPRNAAGTVTLTVSCSNAIRPSQRAALLVGDREVLAQPFDKATQKPAFVVAHAGAGDFFLRLRVDGIDSLLVDPAATPPAFDPTQKVTIS